MKHIAVFDIDGTLADVEHRRHYVQNKPKNWKAFNASMIHDGRMERTISTLHDMKNSDEWIILIATGRGAENRDSTVQWLKENDISYEKLYMRAERDYRSDDIVKEEILDQIIEEYGNPLIVFDDRNQVVDMWRRRGLVVHQVAEGDF